MKLILFGSMLRYLFRTKVRSSSGFQGKKISTDGDNKLVPIFKKALLYANNISIKDFAGQYTYLQLHDNSKILSRQISNICGSGSNSTVAFFTSNDILTMVILWASWMSGQRAMAITRGQSADELANLIKRTKAKLILSSNVCEKFSKELAFENSIPFIHIDHKFLNIYKTSGEYKPEVLSATQDNKIPNGVLLNEFYEESEAIIADTNKNASKAILRTHKDLDIQLKKAVQSFNISKNDKILYMCPSFHSNNDEYIFNLLFPLSVGSQVHLFEPFASKVAWRAILGINIHPKERINALIAEPEVYQQLIREYDEMFAGDKRMVEYIKEYCINNIRLMISCFNRPDSITCANWLKITGHSLQDSHYSIECVNSGEVDHAFENSVHTCFPKSSNIRIRIVNEKNIVLLELNGAQTERFPILSTVVIGRIMTSKHDEMFCHTGKIVSYCNGVFKIIGRYLCNSN